MGMMKELRYNGRQRFLIMARFWDTLASRESFQSLRLSAGRKGERSMSLRKSIIFFVLQLVLGAASGATAAEPRMLGVDDNSCQAWAESKGDAEKRTEYISWARGFLSGHNYANQKQQVSDVSRSTLEMFIERFCRDSPTGQFSEAVYRMSDQYSGRGKPITK
jgi:hypothetical protein